MAARHPDLSRAAWRKSSYSSSTGQNCLEVAIGLANMVAVRDSNDPQGPKLTISLADWNSFIRQLKASAIE
jgi:hypothetical protein